MLNRVARLKVDERVVKVLAAVDLHGDLSGIAARGARYGFPGWERETTTKAGKPKVELLERQEAGERAREFLAGAKSAGELAGRALCLIAMAHLADEEAVAMSRRSYYSLHVSGHGGVPWGEEVLALVEEIATERLPERLTAAVRERRHREAEEADEARRAQAARERAAAELSAQLEGMSPDQRSEALAAFGEEHGRHTVEAQNLRAEVQRLNAAQPEPGVTSGAAAAAEAQADGEEESVEP